MVSRKEIQDDAVLETRARIDGAKPPFYIALPYFEEFLLRGTKNEQQYMHAQTLIDDIAHDSGFMIACVFDKTHRRVTALPNPEIIDENGRRVPIEQGYTNIRRSIIDVKNEVYRRLERQKTHPSPYILDDVVLIEKNLGLERRSTPITVSGINTQLLLQHKRDFMGRVKEVQDELNVIRAPGK